MFPQRLSHTFSRCPVLISAGPFIYRAAQLQRQEIFCSILQSKNRTQRKIYRSFTLQRPAEGGLAVLDCEEEERQTYQDGISSGEASSSGREPFCVVSFYHLVDLAQPLAVVRQHRDWLRDKDILGRIYVSSQGINAQLSGPAADAHAYARWVADQPNFKGLLWSSDPAGHHQFPRLRLKVRENLVQLAGGTKGLPITDQQARAKPLSPAAWQSMLQSAAQRHVPAGNRASPIVLDVRNSYEWDAGHFTGAQRPTEEHFHQTPTREVPRHLADSPKDTPIMMYCTGGIRCDIYSTFLRQKGFQNLYTLQGGVANYLRQFGPADWNGSLFTFDDRLAVRSDGGSLSTANLSAAAPCQRCGGSASLPHMNCANLDCNRLFLACPHCQEALRGCCSRTCMDAPRILRLPKVRGSYSAWHSCVEDPEAKHNTAAIRSGRGSGRRARRMKRLERLKKKHVALREEKQRRRELIRTALGARAAERADPSTEARNSPPSPQQSILPTLSF